MTDTSTPQHPFDIGVLRERFWKVNTDLVTITEVARMEGTTRDSVYTRASRRGLIRHAGVESSIAREDIPKLRQVHMPWRSVNRSGTDSQSH